MSASISTDDWMPIERLQEIVEEGGGTWPTFDAAEYEAACAHIDSWRSARPRGVRRVSYTTWSKPGHPDEVRAFATDRSAFVATGCGATVAAAELDLARKLPLPAPAPLPTLATYAEIAKVEGLADLGTERDHSPRTDGETVRVGAAA
ncbi:hypothetical protein [Sandaracinus amylolyticus]|uniref:Uncharacterized protein n=1 Tax=Sandaracinus amylolyticus TaxID=927083 RepID=A0A0F6W6R6_9BACT|nr:hypothetical protein [Sandaracinus amylolyticus]AKF08855.1 hypothetical protein DB32_006004 [Sandaracinus amylolyticus]